MINYLCLQIHPHNKNALALRGTTFQKKHMHEEAINDFSTLLEIDPQNVDILQSRGVAHLLLAFVSLLFIPFFFNQVFHTQKWECMMWQFMISRMCYAYSRITLMLHLQGLRAIMLLVNFQER
jgi:hypothetical protein